MDLGMENRLDETLKHYFNQSSDVTGVACLDSRGLCLGSKGSVKNYDTGCIAEDGQPTVVTELKFLPDDDNEAKQPAKYFHDEKVRDLLQEVGSIIPEQDQVNVAGSSVLLAESGKSVILQLPAGSLNKANISARELAARMPYRKRTRNKRLSGPRILNESDTKYMDEVAKSTNNHVYWKPQKSYKNIQGHDHDYTPENSNHLKKFYPCLDCKLSFNTLSTYERHLYSCKGDRPFACSKCDKSFSKVQDITCHYWTHVSKVDWPLECEYCQAKFYKKNDLTKHQLIHSEYRPFVCGFCQKSFIQKSNMVRHIKARHADNINMTMDDSPVPVMVEEQSVKQVQVIHILDERGEKLKVTSSEVNLNESFYCSFCNKAFTRKDNMSKHERRHRDGCKHSCDFPACNKTFRDKDNLRRHMIGHQEHKSYSCPHCLKGFHRKEKMEEHVRQHTGERPYSCADSGCSKRFASAASLFNHRKSHSVSKPGTIICHMCSAAFSRNSDFTKHLKTPCKKAKFDSWLQLVKERALRSKSGEEISIDGIRLKLLEPPAIMDDNSKVVYLPEKLLWQHGLHDDDLIRSLVVSPGDEQAVLSDPVTDDDTARTGPDDQGPYSVTVDRTGGAGAAGVMDVLRHFNDQQRPLTTDGASSLVLQLPADDDLGNHVMLQLEDELGGDQGALAEEGAYVLIQSNLP